MNKENNKDFLMEQEQGTAVTAPQVDRDVENDDDDDNLVIKFKKPFMFEGKEYQQVDLSGLETLSAADMIAINKYMDRTARGTQVMPEVSLEYACILASKAANLPAEFFTSLPPKEAIKVKSRVVGFLFGVD